MVITRYGKVFTFTCDKCECGFRALECELLKFRPEVPEGEKEKYYAICPCCGERAIGTKDPRSSMHMQEEVAIVGKVERE